MKNLFFGDQSVKLFFSICAALCLASLPASAVVAPSPTLIGSEASIGLPQSALWNKTVNIRPGNGDIVTLNPPRFSWPYYYPMTNSKDLTAKQFVFQAAYNPQFTNLVVNVFTPSSMYNFLAPFTNSPVYWRVGYVVLGTTTTNIYYTNSFSIASNATVWDRSMLANTNYLAQKLVHPYIMFNASNRAAMSQWIQTNTATYLHSSSGWTRAQFSNMVAQANQTIASSWWGNFVPSPTVLYEGTWAVDVANVAFVWQMTQNPAYTNANPQLALVAMATNFVAKGGPYLDYISAQVYIREYNAMACAYDWLYQIMTPEQRQTVVYALDQRCQYELYTNGVWYDPNAYTQYWFSQFQVGTSHIVDDFHFTIPGALAAYNESTNCQLFANLGLNYMISIVNSAETVHCDDGQGEGITYGPGHLFGGYGALYAAMFAQATLPEAQFNLNPFWSNSVDFWDRFEPVGFLQGNNAWGDVNYGTANMASDWDWGKNFFGRGFAYFTGSGVAYTHWTNVVQSVYGDSSTEDYSTLPLLYDFRTQPPSQIDPNGTGKLYTNAGWMISSTYAPNTTNCFNNGVGLIFQARPAGNDVAHSHFSDLSFQIWAYGALVTDAGAGMTGYAKVPWCHYSLLVNGLGEAQPEKAPILPYYCKFIGFEDTSNYTYVAADATAAYPHTPFSIGGWLIPNQFLASGEGTGALAFVQKVQRHVLFMRRKYVVLYDDLASLEPATYTWLYHVMPNNLQLNTNNMSFTYTVTNNYGGNVLVEVAHIATPQALDVLDETGTNVYTNPFTGENDYALTAGGWFPRANELWFSNINPATNFHFMTVIYPVPPGAAAPQITRLDDYTVAVTNGTEADVISFDPNTKFPATTIINEPSISAAGACDDVIATTNIPVVPASSSSVAAPVLTAPTNLRFLVAEPPYITPTITNGLVGWWRFDEGSGEGANDTSGTLNTGELAGTSTNFPAWGPGEIGDALTFDGATEFIYTANVVNASLVTISAWVNIPVLPASQQTIVGFDNGFNARAEDKVLYLNTDGKPYFYVYASGAMTTSAPASAIVPGVWTFIAGVYDGTNAITYVNGVQVGSVALSGNSYCGYTAPNIFIAAPIGNGTFNYFNGSIDDVRVYNRPLSPSEVAAVYNWRGP
jgi:hypothetical protein